MVSRGLIHLDHSLRLWVLTHRLDLLNPVMWAVSVVGAANVFAGAFMLSRIVPAARMVWWTMALMIAYSRVYLGVHYPLDVIGGAVVGWLCGVFVDRFVAWKSAPADSR
jgi:undecaprenyl-diphosphatase